MWQMMKLLIWALSLWGLLGVSANAGEVTILFWPGGPESHAMLQEVKNFNAGPGKAEGITAKVIFFNRNRFFDRIYADLASGSTKFDLNLLTTYSLGRYAQFQEPVERYFHEDFFKIIPNTSLALMTHEGQLYGYPTDVGSHFMIYRKDYMEALLTDSHWQENFQAIAQTFLGKPLTPKSPDDWTYEDYQATALFFTKKVNPQSPTRYGTALQLKNILFNVMLWNGVMASHGGQWFKDVQQTEPNIHSEEVKAAHRVYKFLIEQEATPKDSFNYEFQETNMAFASGQVFSIMQWNAGYVELNHPERYPNLVNKIGLAPLPTGPIGRKSHMHSLGLGMNKASQNKEEAGKVLRYLTSPESLLNYARNGGTPSVPSILANLPARPELKLFSEILTHNGIVIEGSTSEHALKIYEMMADKFAVYWAGQAALDQTLAEVENEMKRIIKSSQFMP